MRGNNVLDYIATSFMFHKDALTQTNAILRNYILDKMPELTHTHTHTRARAGIPVPLELQHVLRQYSCFLFFMLADT